MQRGRVGVGIVWLLALVPFAYLVTRFDFVCDDAFISYRYAAHLARGDGLRFNLGVEPPVEGYTDLGWILWIALLQWLGVGAVTVVARATTILSGGLLLGLVARTTRDAGAGRLGVTAAALFFATLPQVGTWSTGGLGTMTFALTVFWSAAQLLGREPNGLRAGLAGALVALQRADGMWWVASIAAIAWCLARDEHARRETRRFAAIGAAAVVALFAFRIAVHGDWVPNTARAKVAFSWLSLERGGLYVASFFTVLPAALVVPLASLPRAVSERRGTATWALAMVASTCVYSALVGGDFMAFHRFLLPALPFLAVLVGLLVDRIAARAGNVAANVVLAILVATSVSPAFGIHVVPARWREAAHFRWGLGYLPEAMFWTGMKERAERWTVLGKALALHTTPGESIVMGTIGAAGYYSDLFVFDRRGLVTREVNSVPIPEGQRTTPGHDRQVPASFFLPWNPTYLDAHVSPASAPTPPGTATRRIVRKDLPESEGFPPGRTLVLVRPAGRHARRE